MTQDGFARFIERRTRGEMVLPMLLTTIAIFAFGIGAGEFLAWMTGAAGA